MSVKVWAPNLPRINFWIKCCCVPFCWWWKEAVCVQTHALQPPPEGRYLADSLQPLFVLPIPALLGPGGWIPACAFPGPAAPLIVLLSEGVCLPKPYQIPPKPCRQFRCWPPEHKQLRACLGAEQRDRAWCWCVQTWWLCHRDGAPAWGGDPGAGGAGRLVGLAGESNSCLCQHEDKCKEINSYLKSKWGHSIRLWHVSV